MELLRLLSGLSRVAESRDANLVELKVGQVVRGVLLKMLSEQEGMVSIAGVQVRARLETPLKPGEATLLQVQPESAGSLVVLKPLTGSETPIAERSMADLLHWLGMKNTETNRQLLQIMHQAGMPIDKETVRVMQRIAELRPEGTDAGRWLAAASVANGKQLPLTRGTVLALHAVLFGKSPGEALHALRETLSAWLRSSAGNPAAGTETARTAERLLALLDRLARATEDRLGQPPGQAARMNPDTGQARVAQAGTVPGGQGLSGTAATVQTGTPSDGRERAVRPDEAVPQSGREAGSAAARTADGDRPAAMARAGGQGQAQNRVLTQTMRPAEPVISQEGSSGIARSAEGRETRAAETSARSAAAQGAEGAMAATRHAADDRVQAFRTNAFAESAARGQAPGPRPEPWLVTLFRDLGFEHEQRLYDRLLQPGEGTEALRETVKSLIMTLQADSQLPPAVREALQQTLQAITGQQLLLAADRQAPFSVVTMTVPLFKTEEGGEQSATVQIHARRPKGGALDAANCRLLFDLNLAELGALLMDVQVVDRTVSVKVHSDHPACGPLLAGGKREAEEALADIGYRLASLYHLPYPDRDGSQQKNGAGDGVFSAPGGLVPAFDPKPYKGVDVRI